MSPCKSGPKTFWKRLVRWCGLGQSNTQKKPVEDMALHQAHLLEAKRATRSKSPCTDRATYQQVSSLSGGTEPAPVIAELAYLNSNERRREFQMASFRRGAVEEEPPRGRASLNADRKINAKQSVTGDQDYILDGSDSDDDDDEDRPVAKFLPRGYKLTQSPSRDHLTIVRKSAMSPLNGCEQAPKIQRRRTPAPFLTPVYEGQSSINEIAMTPIELTDRSPPTHSLMD